MSFSIKELEGYVDFARRMARAARAETLPRFRSGLIAANKTQDDQNKEFDPVTDADREAERALRAMINEHYPTHGVVGEEFGETPGDGPWRWVLDPVDGTRAFVCGGVTWVTLIALEYEQKPVLGVIDQPYTDECWVGANGAAFLARNNQDTSCRTSGVTALEKARIATTDPRPAAYFTHDEAAAFDRLGRASRVVRFSMDAYAYGLLALGELDLVVEAGLQLHDFAALAPIIEGAGGVITNWRGDPVGADARGETLAAATPELHAAALAVLVDS